MKKKNIILLFLMVLAGVGCHKDTDPAAESPEVRNVKVNPSQTGANFVWNVVDMPGKFQTGVEVSGHENMSDLLSLPALESEEQFVASIDSLTPNTTYYYRIVVWNRFKRFEFPQGNGTAFTTSETPTPPGQDTTYYNITVSVNLAEGGRATGDGRFAESDTCTVTATANEGYVFVNWTEEGTSVADSMAYSFEVRHDRHLVANFVEESAVLYTVTAQAEPEEGGRVTGGGTYEEGQTCTLTATAYECYDFVNWTKDGEEVSQDTVCTFDVTGDVTYMAHFQLKRYAITVAADPTNGGEVIGGDTYDCGETCTVRATEAQGYTFVNWTENGAQVHHESEYTFTVRRGRDLVANFVELQPNQYLIQAVIDPSGGGTVIGNGPYNEGQTCTLTATPENCYEFVNWTKNGEVVSQNSVYTFNVTEAATYVAHFQLINYKVTVSAGIGGSAYVGEMQGVFSQNVDCGESCTVHARPEQGYTFVNWTENGIEASRERDYTFNVTDNHNLTANFTQETYTITVNAGTGGTASGGGQYHYGETATLTATADDCYQFESWNDGNTNNPREVNVTGNATYTASFSSLHYTISVTHGTGGTAYIGSSTTLTSYTFDCGANCTVHAVADNGYTFANWTKTDGTVASTNANYTFDVDEACTLKANFTQQYYTITVNASPADGGTVQIMSDGISYYGNSHSFAYGTIIQLIATANSGYSFTNWKEGNTVISTTATTSSITIYGAHNYTATFEAQPQAPTGAINGKFTINANGDKVYFSQGNLQYRASTNTWQFAANQYDYIGSDNSNISQTYSGWIDLFGWGTSGYHDTSDPYNVNYQPWSTSTSTVNETYNYNGYGPSTNMPSPNLTGSSANYDWGVYNAISNGGGQAGQWRTLTREEWVWVLGPSSSPSPGVNCRTSSTVNGTPNARYAKGQVAGVHGVIVFPDSYTHPSGVAQPVGINETGNTGWIGNDYSSTDFGRMEANGAVFLPAAGDRWSSVNNVGSGGYYRSASYGSSSNAYGVFFVSGHLYPSGSSSRYGGLSVRLVAPVEN